MYQQPSGDVVRYAVRPCAPGLVDKTALDLPFRGLVRLVEQYNLYEVEEHSISPYARVLSKKPLK
jgi:hypothetical protein